MRGRLGGGCPPQPGRGWAAGAPQESGGGSRGHQHPREIKYSYGDDYLAHTGTEQHSGPPVTIFWVPGGLTSGGPELTPPAVPTKAGVLLKDPGVPLKDTGVL